MEANFTKSGRYENAVVRGGVPGASIFSSYGELTTSGAVTDHMIWPLAGTGDLAVPAEAGVQLTISSSTTNDAAAGTGIQTLKIHYLDGNLNEQSEIIAMNGTTGVTTAATDIRYVNCMHIVTVGSDKAADGNISAVHSGTTYGYIASGKRRCSNSFCRIPAGKRLLISGLYAGSSSGSAAAKSIVRLVTTGISVHDYTEDAITIPHAGIALQDSTETMVFEMPFPVPAGAVVGFEVTTNKAATINAGFFGWLENV